MAQCCISMPDEYKKWIEDHNISLSTFVQKAIENEMKNPKSEITENIESQGPLEIKNKPEFKILFDMGTGGRIYHFEKTNLKVCVPKGTEELMREDGTLELVFPDTTVKRINKDGVEIKDGR